MATRLPAAEAAPVRLPWRLRRRSRTVQSADMALRDSTETGRSGAYSAGQREYSAGQRDYSAGQWDYSAGQREYSADQAPHILNLKEGQ